MSEHVNRTYSSALRDRQAQETRRSIVAAAARLFVRDGFGATTMDAIATEAGVSRKTVFTSVGGKVECLKLAYDWAVAGDDGEEPLIAREPVQTLMQEPDARRLLRGYAALFCRRAARAARLPQVVDEAVGLDASVRGLRDELDRQRHVGMTNLAQQLRSRKALRRDVTVDQAAQILSFYHRSYFPLVITHGWSEKRYLAFLSETLESALIRPDYAPASLR